MRIGFLLICIIYKFIETIPNYDKLIFEENFDKSTLNLSKWEFDLGNGKNGWGIMNINIIEKMMTIYT